MMTEEEKKVLSLLETGELDGRVGDCINTSGGSSIWIQIKDGIPIKYKEGPGGRFFNNRENTYYSGKLYVLQEWKTENEKLCFLQKYGWLIKHPLVKKYSAKFKQSR